MVAKVIMGLFFVVHGGTWMHGTFGNILVVFVIFLVIFVEVIHVLKIIKVVNNPLIFFSVGMENIS